MSRIGSWWLASFDAEAGEQIQWTIFANRTQSSLRAVGGKLYVTNQRLLFCPHLFDYVLGGKRWAASVRDIVQVDKQEKGGDLYGGGLRDRLGVTLTSGSTELFVVNNLERVIIQLRASLSRSKNGEDYKSLSTHCAL